MWTTQKHVPRWDLPAGLAGAQLGVKTPLPIHEGASRHTVRGKHNRCCSTKTRALCSSLQSPVKFGLGDQVVHYIQVGSRGLLDMSSLKSIENFTNSRQSRKSFLCLLHKICRIVIGCSFAIWCKRNKSDWKDTDLFI